MQDNTTNIIRLRESIKQEIEASLNGLCGLAVVGRHAFLNARATRGAERILRLVEEGRRAEALRLMDLDDWGASGDEVVEAGEMREGGLR